MVIIGIKTSNYLLANALTLQLFFCQSFKLQATISKVQQPATLKTLEASNGNHQFLNRGRKKNLKP